MYSKKRQFGNIGEDIAVKHLVSKGFSIIDRNYLKKWGEIDIVARGTDHKLHFIEVKSVSREISSNLKKIVSHDTFRPEENVTRAKLLKMERTISSWTLEHEFEGDWQIDVVTIELDMEKRVGRFRMSENVY